MGKILKILLIMTSLMAAAQAKTVKVNAIGSSPKGQYLAIEEFGYIAGSNRPFTRIRVINAWKNKYVDKPILIQAHKGKLSLDVIRKKAMQLAMDKFKKFNITY